MKDMEVFNPCKLCLTKATCIKPCKDLINHINTVAIIYNIVWIIWFGVCEYFFIYYAFKYINSVFVWSFIITTLCIIYSYLWIHALTFIHDFKKMPRMSRVVIIILAPTLLPPIFVWQTLINPIFNIDDMIQDFNFRYNKKIQ